MSYLQAIDLRSSDAILNVDLTLTFMEGGGLPVPGGHGIISTVLRVNELFTGRQRYSTYEAHETGHIYRSDSFLNLAPYSTLTLGLVDVLMGSGRTFLSPCALFTTEELRDYVSRCLGQQMTIWPKHSDRLDRSGELHPALAAFQHMYILRKGADPLRGSLGCFANDIGEETELDGIMKRNGVERIFITGLALNYCVAAAALQAAERGYEACIILPATAGIDVPAGHVQETLVRLETAGVRFVNDALEPTDRFGQRLTS